MPEFADAVDDVAIGSRPCTIASSHSPERAVNGRCIAGVARWLCGESGIGTTSLGPVIWLNTAHIPAGAETSSMKPMPTSERAVMRDAKLAVSK